MDTDKINLENALAHARADVDSAQEKAATNFRLYTELRKELDKAIAAAETAVERGRALEWLVGEVKEASFPIARSFDNFCRVDHHGQCQSHLIDKPCSVVLFRRALSRTEADYPGRSEMDRKAT